MQQSRPNHTDLERIRCTRGWTQEQMAEHLDVTRSYYNQVEKGSRPLRGKLQARVELMLKSEFTDERLPINTPNSASNVDEDRANYFGVRKIGKSVQSGEVASTPSFRDNDPMFHILDDKRGRTPGDFNFEDLIRRQVTEYLNAALTLGASPEVIYHALRRHLQLSEWDYLTPKPPPKPHPQPHHEK